MLYTCTLPALVGGSDTGETLLQVVSIENEFYCFIVFRTTQPLYL